MEDKKDQQIIQLKALLVTWITMPSMLICMLGLLDELYKYGWSGQLTAFLTTMIVAYVINRIATHWVNKNFPSGPVDN